MKKTKILVPAMGMLLLSTAASVTGTVAWFATNASVTATGMQLSAKTDNTYLLISATNSTAGAIQTQNEKDIDLEWDDEDCVVYPSAPCLTAAEAGYLTTSAKDVDGDAITVAGVQVTNAATAAAVTNWYTASALGPGATTIDTSSAVQLKSFTNYVLVQNFYLTVAAGSNAAIDLSVTATFTQKSGGEDVSAVKMIVTTNDNGFAALSTTNATADIKGSNSQITSSTVRTVTCYIYYDGNDANVYTNNMAVLKGAEISLRFTVRSAAGN